MSTTSKVILVSLLAVGGLTALAIAPVEAAPHRHKAAKIKGPPAHLKAGYVGAPGYVGGTPGRAAPALFDEPASMGVFKGVPILGDTGL